MACKLYRKTWGDSRSSFFLRCHSRKLLYVRRVTEGKIGGLFDPRMIHPSRCFRFDAYGNTDVEDARLPVFAVIPSGDQRFFPGKQCE